MTRQEILAFLQSHPIFHLATVEGGEPRVRGMFLYRADGDGIVFHSGKMKDVHHQIEADPRVELCFNDNEKGVQVRVRGTLDIVDDSALMDEICEDPARAFLKNWRDSAGSREMFYRNFAVYRMKGGTAVVWTMAENFAPKRWIDL